MNDASAPWQLEPPGHWTRVFLFVITLLLPIGVTLAALDHAFADGADLRLIADSRVMTGWITVGAVGLFSVVLWWILHRSLRRHRITLADGSIEVATSFYKRRLTLDDLRLDEARAVDLDEHTQLKTRFKTNAAAMPGFSSGWFRLRNGSKALVATTGGKRVAWIPTRAGYDLLLQPRRPQALLDELRRMAGASPRR